MTSELSFLNIITNQKIITLFSNDGINIYNKVLSQFKNLYCDNSNYMIPNFKQLGFNNLDEQTELNRYLQTYYILAIDISNNTIKFAKYKKNINFLILTHKFTDINKFKFNINKLIELETSLENYYINNINFSDEILNTFYNYNENLNALKQEKDYIFYKKGLFCIGIIVLGLFLIKK